MSGYPLKDMSRGTLAVVSSPQPAMATTLTVAAVVTAPPVNEAP